MQEETKTDQLPESEESAPTEENDDQPTEIGPAPTVQPSSYTKPPSGSGGLGSGDGQGAGTAGDISGAGSGAGGAAKK